MISAGCFNGDVYKRQVNDIALSKAFDNGMICASEQAVIVDKEIYDDVKDQFKNYNVHYANKKEKEMLEQYMFGVKAFTKNVGAAKLNPDIVGKSAALSLIHICFGAGMSEKTNSSLNDL